VATRIARGVLIGLLIAAHASIASAEVSDKAATIPQHWLLAIPLAAVLFLVARFRWRLGALLAVVPALVLWASYDLTFDGHVGSALLHEQGWPYFASLWGSDLLLLAALVLGIHRGWQRGSTAHGRPPEVTLPS